MSSLKSVFFLAGTVLLIAGCSNGPTSPRAEASGGAASSARAGAKNATVKTPKTSTGGGTANAADGEECRAGYSVNSGRTDSVCLDDIQ